MAFGFLIKRGICMIWIMYDLFLLLKIEEPREQAFSNYFRGGHLIRNTILILNTHLLSILHRIPSVLLVQIRFNVNHGSWGGHCSTLNSSSCSWKQFDTL